MGRSGTLAEVKWDSYMELLICNNNNNNKNNIGSLQMYIGQFLYQYTELLITKSLLCYYPGFSRAAHGHS